VLELIAKEVVGVVVELEEVPAAAMVILREADAVCPVASVAAKVKALVPAFAGVPDKTPALLNPRPVLHEPEQLTTAQV
jgi:hypothetical protein